jgi:hypothetical protein
MVRIALVLSGLFPVCGCSGSPTPPGQIWKIVTLSVQEPNGKPFEQRITDYLRQKLPAGYRDFNDLLQSERFASAVVPFYHPKGPNTVECVYFERGPIRDNPCVAGEDAAVAVSFTELGEDSDQRQRVVTDFKVRGFHRMDQQIHASGMCLML